MMLNLYPLYGVLENSGAPKCAKTLLNRIAQKGPVDADQHMVNHYADFKALLAARLRDDSPVVEFSEGKVSLSPEAKKVIGYVEA